MWHETKKEFEIDQDGNYTPKKATLELKKTIWGFERKEFFDFSIRTLSLCTIVFAFLSYFNTLKQQTKNEHQEKLNRQENQLRDQEQYIRKLKEDSILNINYKRNQERLDRELNLRQLEIIHNQISSKKNIELKQEELQTSLLNIIQSIELQKKAEQETFINKKKFDAISEFKKHFGILSENLDKMVTGEMLPNQDIISSGFYECINDLISYSILFNDTQIRTFNLCLWLYRGIVFIDSKEWETYSEFLHVINKVFKCTCLEVLGFDQDEQCNSNYSFIEVPESPNFTINTQEFLISNYQNWKKLNPN